MKRYTFNVDAKSVAGSQTYYVDAESEQEARVIVEGGGGEFVCEELEVQDLGTFELADVEEIPVELEATRATPADHSVPVAKIVGVDEYGPIIEWTTHWIDLKGAKLFTSPQVPQKDADHISQARDAVIEECAKVCEAWSAEVDATNKRNRVVAAAMTGALSCAAAIRALTTPGDR